MFSRLVILVSLIASGIAKPFLTSPVAGSVCSGGATCSIKWQDDGVAPALDAFGESTVGLYVGNVNQQTLLQSITNNVNVATTASIDFTVDPNAGPNDDVYFIRFDSNTGRNGSAPYQAFSAKFTLNSMSGQFNATVQNQINAVDGTSAASSAASTGSSSSSSSITKVSSSASKASGLTTASASSSSSTANGAGRIGVAGGLVGAAGAMTALFALAL